jgi:hypothetical protein
MTQTFSSGNLLEMSKNVQKCPKMSKNVHRPLVVSGLRPPRNRKKRERREKEREEGKRGREREHGPSCAQREREL